MTTLNLRQRAILYFIKGFIDDYQYSPTIGEICKGMNASQDRAIRYHVLELQAKGYLKIIKGTARNIVLQEVA